ncbi:HARP [Mytilus edulis]|uniref:SMARCAL1 n=1 Tax=Mytilus edulis TaxID=6550 RepID=A0A8S3TG65_MYTED|nr:HARP [Mytilus edulis]
MLPGSNLYKPPSSTASHKHDSKGIQNFTGTLPSQEKLGINREYIWIQVLFQSKDNVLISRDLSQMKEVTVFRPHVTIEPLPKAILQVFNSQLKGNYTSKDIPNADLSEVDVSLVNSLLSFQREGVNFSVSKNGRVLIADDMGLGKTIQAICLACYYREEWPLLIIVPSSVRFDWAQQIRRWVPSIDPQEISVATTGKDTSSNRVNIVTYDLVARKAKYLQDKHFKIVIVDECHLLKNYKTARCKAALPILQNAHRVILLSGTPALSRPSELYTQISAISPFMFKFQDFGIRYCDGKHQPWGWDFSGSSNMAELQILLEEKIMIRNGQNTSCKVRIVIDFLSWKTLYPNRWKDHQKNRNIFCKKFQENPDYKLAILSITAANAGINLSAATLVGVWGTFLNPGYLYKLKTEHIEWDSRIWSVYITLVAQTLLMTKYGPWYKKEIRRLNKAGLSKDDFSSADTTTLVLKDSRQTDLMQYFEESFIEEDDSFIAENVDQIEGHDDNVVDDSHSKKDGSLLNYFSSKKKGSSKNVPASSSLKNTNTLQMSGQCVNIEGQSSKDDFEDDLELLMEDDDWDEEPQQKKFKT